MRKARLWQLLAAIGYVAMLSLGLLIRPSSLSPGALIGTLISICEYGIIAPYAGYS